VGLLSDRGRGLEADEQRDREQDPVEDAVGRAVVGGEHRQRVAGVAALGDDRDGQDQERDQRDAGQREHAADGQAHAEVVEPDGDDQRDQPPDPPGDLDVQVGGEEALGQKAVGDEHAAAAQEQHTEPVEPGAEHADAGMGAVDEVLIQRAGAREAPGVERDHVAERQRSDRAEQHRQGRAEPGHAGHEPGQQAGREHRADGQGLSDRVDRGQSPLAQVPPGFNILHLFLSSGLG
jgi:hypothetical protein